jgi:hypothetical protein
VSRVAICRQRSGYQYRTPKTLLINVHTVLGRIKDELDVVERDGKTAYKAKSVDEYPGMNPVAFQQRLHDALKAEGMNDLAEAFKPVHKDGKIIFKDIDAIIERFRAKDKQKD